MLVKRVPEKSEPSVAKSKDTINGVDISFKNGKDNLNKLSIKISAGTSPKGSKKHSISPILEDIKPENRISSSFFFSPISQKKLEIPEIPPPKNYG